MLTLPSLRPTPPPSLGSLSYSITLSVLAVDLNVDPRRLILEEGEDQHRRADMLIPHPPGTIACSSCAPLLAAGGAIVLVRAATR